MTKLKIIQKNKEAELLYLLVFQIPEEIKNFYTIPGQYGIFSYDQEKKFYFAISNSPLNSYYYEVLIKIVNTDLEKILTCDFLYLYSIEGKGFPLKEIQDQEVVAFAMGSGISPIRALIQYYLNKNIHLKSFELWFSAFNEDYLPFKKDFKKWESLFPVHYIFDKKPPYKNVIDHLKNTKSDFSQKKIIWVGSKEYGNDLKNALINLGLQEKNFLSNI